VIRRLTVGLLLCMLSACGPSAPAAAPTRPGTRVPPTPTPLPTLTVPSTAVPGVLSVDPGQDLGPISPYLYGSNISPETTIPAGMMDEALQSGITALRFPGGSWADNNDVSDFQIDLYMAIFKKMGAMPVFTVRLEGGTPQAAAQLVHYVNIEKDYGVRYWEIGNEPNLYASTPGIQYDTVRFDQDWRAFAQAMRAVDPTIQLVGPEISQFTGVPNTDTYARDVHGLDWMTEFLKANGDLVNVVSFHRYPFPKASRGPNATIEGLRTDPPEWTNAVRDLRALIRSTTGRDLPVAVTEGNSHYNGAVGGQATPDSFYNALWWADVLGRMMDENVFMVNQWDMNTPGMMGDGYGLLATAGVRPIYYTYQMYKHFGSEHVYAASGVADVTIYAAKAPGGALTLMVINLSDEEKQAPLQIAGLHPGQADTWLFDAAHNAADLGLQSLPADGRLSLPAQSISLWIVK